MVFGLQDQGMNSLPTRADVVVIGAGIVGASVAFHLAEIGIRPVVLDVGDVGGGSSGKPLGGVRAQFSDALNIALAARSLDAYQRFEHRPGVAIGLQQVGYLFLLRTPDHLEAFERSVAAQNANGVASRLVTPSEAAQLSPMIDRESIVGAAFSPGDGHARPRLAIKGYLEAAASLGARVVSHCAVTGIEVRDGEIVAVQTRRGRVQTSTVVCAAGAWSADVGAMAGVALDVRPVRRQIAFTPGLRPRAPESAFTIDYASTFYFHNADDAVLLGMSDPNQAPGFDVEYTTEWLPELRRLAARCAPRLADVPLTHGWAGLYELTPDHNALIGESQSVGRFLYATGFSGHGFCQAPAAGEIIRDLVRGRTPFVDVTPLRAERFAAHAPILEANIV